MQSIREANSQAIASQKHQDIMSIWIVSLSTGMIGLAGFVFKSVLNLEPSSISMSSRILFFTPFFLTVIISVLHRLALYKLGIADAILFINKTAFLTLINVEGYNVGYTEELRERFAQIITNEAEPVKTMSKTVDCWKKVTNFFFYSANILFLIGILIFAAVLFGQF